MATMQPGEGFYFLLDLNNKENIFRFMALLY